MTGIISGIITGSLLLSSAPTNLDLVQDSTLVTVEQQKTSKSFGLRDLVAHNPGSISSFGLTEIEDVPVLLLGITSFPPVSNQAPDYQLSPFELLEESNNNHKPGEDHDDWFENHGLTIPKVAIPGGIGDANAGAQNQLDLDVPQNITLSNLKNLDGGIVSPSLTLKLINVIEQEDRVFFIYHNLGTDRQVLYSYDRSNDSFHYAYDFSNYRFPNEVGDSEARLTHQSINWVQQVGDKLFVSHSHRTYAAESKNLNGYITAIDTKTNQVLWRSSSLISNSRNFVMLNNMIITGYGFTAEPDYLYVIRADTGKIAIKLQLDTAAYYFAIKERKLYIRTYGKNWVFDIIYDI